MASPRALVVCLLASVIATVAALVAACDSEGTLVSSDAGADVRTFDVVYFDGPTVFESGGPGDGGAHDGAVTGDGGAFGFIELSQVQVGGGQFVAAFYATPLEPAPGCSYVVADAGPCLVTSCPSKPPTDAGGVSLVTAGALTVTGGAFGDAGVELAPDTLGSYLYNTVGPMFAPGDTLSVTGGGGTVPAFATQTLTAPGPISISAPLADAGVLTIPTTTDLAVSWTGGTTGDRFFLSLSAFFTSGASASTLCSWQATLGQGTVPASALAPLKGGTPQEGRSSALWYQQADTTFNAGRWTVAMRAFSSSGALVSFQ
jgi:hypothetical protein